MKKTYWIYMICALTLFSAQQTRRHDADRPDYSRSPAMVRPAEVRGPHASKTKPALEPRLKGSFHKPSVIVQ